MGTLHAARLDIDVLVEAAKLRPSWSFVLIGPDLLEPADRGRLLGLANVHHLGVRPHPAIRGYLEGLDVCLVPHRDTEFTRSLDPLKLYEYLATGRPVVATPVAIVAELKSHIALASTAEELVVAAERAIALDSTQRSSARREAVAGATWEARAEELGSVLGIAGEPTPRREVCAVIVSINTRELLKRCLTDLRAQQGVDLHLGCRLSACSISTQGSDAT